MKKMLCLLIVFGVILFVLMVASCFGLAFTTYAIPKFAKSLKEGKRKK